MSTPNRRPIREALAAIVQTACEGVTSNATVYAYQVADLKGFSPVVALTSGGTTRDRVTMRGSKATVEIDVHLFVLHTDRKAGWTERDAEDLLDDLEAAIAEAIDATPANPGLWLDVRYGGATNARATETLAGVVYLHEIIPLAIRTM